MKSLVEIAKTIPKNRKRNKTYSKQEVELIKAWASGEIGIFQLTKAAKLKSPNSAYAYIAFVCKQILSKNGKS